MFMFVSFVCLVYLCLFCSFILIFKFFIFYVQKIPSVHYANSIFELSDMMKRNFETEKNSTPTSKEDFEELRVLSGMFVCCFC
jgi:hypothetical protein